MKNFLLIFGSGNPTQVSGITPTFLVFKTTPGGTDATPPGITQVPSNTGLFYFTYGPTNSISFVVDGGSSLATSVRYISGLLDPIDAVDEQITALGVSMIAGFTAIGAGSTQGFADLNTKIGTTASSFGDSSTDPGTLYGYLKRLQEFNEGNANFDKSTSVWSIYSRGSSALLRTKEFNNTSSDVEKT